MTEDFEGLLREYESALTVYVAGRSEESLARAAAIGRHALTTKMGLLDLVVAHHESLDRLVNGEGQNANPHSRIEAAGEFFCEAMSAFEMSRRGFIDLSETVAQMVHFTSVVSHELRTPLTSLVSSVGMLEEVINPMPGGFEARLLANIGRSAEILRMRTDDLIDLTGFQAGTLQLKPTRVKVARLVADVVRTMTPQLQGAAVEARCEIGEELPELFADPRRLEQILFNLIENAIKYGAEGGKVDIRSYREANDIVIEVQDYGSGVSLSEQMRIFQPNYRSKQAAGEIPGLGIGLALCKELVAQHHGTLTLQSSEGNGSLFRVSLPIVAESRGEGQSCENSSDRRRTRGR